MENRLKLIRRLNFLTAGGISAVYLYGKCFNTENLKQTLELKLEDKAFPVPNSLKSLLNEVKSEIKHDFVRKAKYNLFISKCVDITHFGLPDAFGGAYLGIPSNFVVEEGSHIDLTAVMDGNKPLTDQKEVQALKESMCLSKEAKKFALANELFKSHFTLIVPCGVLPLLTVLKCNFGSYLLEKLAIKQRKPINLSNHIIVFLIGAGFYALFYNMFSVMRETNSVWLTGQLGSSYIQGGIEYYEKMMRRNKVLKKIKKNAPFTEDGDIQKSPLSSMHISLARRLTYLKEFKNERINPWSLLC